MLNVAGEQIAFTVVQNLELLEGQAIDGYYPVIDLTTKEPVANLRISLKIEQPGVEAEPQPRVAKPKFTLKSKATAPRRREPGGSPAASKPAAAAKVTFAKENLGSANAGRTPLADSLVSELLNQSQRLRESMTKRLEYNFSEPQADSKTALEGRGALAEVIPVEARDQEGLSEFESRSVFRDEDTLWSGRTRPPKETAAVPKADVVPSWNLPVDRIKQLARVTRLVLHTFSVQLSPTVLDRISGRETKKPGIRKPRQDKETGSVSFFVKFRLPEEKDESNLCSRRVKANFVEFNERKIYPLLFNSGVLEDWWRYRLDFRIFSRQLNQRVPLLIGEASLPLKQLLLQDR